MKIDGSIIGQKKLAARFKAEEQKLAKAVQNGLTVGALLTQRKSQKAVPVDTGNLKASAFTRREGEGFKSVLNIGYTATYAMYVHEAPMKLKGLPRTHGKGKYWDPQGRARNKFLGGVFQENKEEISQTVRDTVKSFLK